MSTRDFIDSELLPWIEAELAEQPEGSQHFIAGFDAGLKAVRQFIEQRRGDWDSE